MEIRYICIEVSGICNMDCKFCFANWRENIKMLPYEKIIENIKQLKEIGVEAINLTGGDPLLRDDIIQICKYCKSLGIITIISTNAIELQNKKDVLKYIDAINLPLDSYHPEIHNKMRPCKLENHHSFILETISFLNKDYPNIKIKVNTMVGKKNKDDVLKIGTLLEGKVHCWKLSKFLSSGYGKEYEKEFEISECEYKSIAKKCNEKYKNSNILEEEYNPKENQLFSVFVDCYGKVNFHTEKGIIAYNTLKEAKERMEEIKEYRKEYFEKVYQGISKKI